MKFFERLLNYSKEDSLIRDGFILFIATMFGNLAAFFYHFYMGRVLGPEDYSILGVVLSIAYLVNVPAGVLQTTVTKVIAEFVAKKKEKEILNFYLIVLKKFFLYGLILFFIFLLLSRLIANFLKIDILSLLLFAPFIIFALILPICRGVLQGKQKFKSLGINITLESIFKLILGISFVYIELHIYGAVSAITLAISLAFILAYFSLKKKLNLRNNKKLLHNFEDFNIKKFYLYLMPVFFGLLLLTLSYTIDIFIVKHFFSEKEAGLYVALSTIGKIVFFASSAVSAVMFTKVTDLYARGKSSKNILYKSIVFILLIGVPITIFYFFFPNLVVLSLMGIKYLEISGMLWMFAVVMLFFSLNYLFVFYNLSINRIKFLWVLFIWFILECLILGFQHTTIYTIIVELILLNVILFLFMLVYTLRVNNDKK